MTLEPNAEQRRRFQRMPQGPLALVQFLAVKDHNAHVAYRQASADAVQAEGGERCHDVRINQYLAGGQMPFQAITVDRFPSGETALAAFEPVSARRQEALSQVYALAVLMPSSDWALAQI